MKSLVLSSLIVVAALCSRAEEFHWNKSGSGNWHSSSRWTLADGSAAARAPGEGDVAVISGAEALVTDDDQSVISLIGEIQLKDDESVVNFANKRDFTLACPVRGKGLIVKSENGKLFLAACKKYLASDGTSASASLGDHLPTGECVLRLVGSSLRSRAVPVKAIFADWKFSMTASFR